jgi:hypothetical protein
MLMTKVTLWVKKVKRRTISKYRNFPPPARNTSRSDVGRQADPPTEDNPGSRAREGVGILPAATASPPRLHETVAALPPNLER